MLLFEIKKIFSKTINRLALLLLLILLVNSCYLAISGVTYINEDGTTERGFGAVRKLKEVKEEWKGELTEEIIAKVIEENSKIVGTKEYSSTDPLQSNIAYSWGQGFYDIRYLLARSYSGMAEFDYYKPDTLKPADAAAFYSNRTRNLKEWLNTDAKDLFSEAEKEYLFQQYEALEAPLRYGYADGFKQLFAYSPTIIMITMLVLGFLVSGIFPEEFSQKADSVFFSTYHGRGKASFAKLKAGLLVVTAVYFGVMFVYSAVVLGFLGADGANLAIQSGADNWKSIYHITYLQEYGLVLAGGYVGSLFICLITMLVSAKFRSSVLSVIIPFILLFIPSFLSGSNLKELNKILGLLPDQLLNMDKTVKLYNLYQIGGRVVKSAGILFLLYLALSVVLAPVVYQIYRKSEIK